MYSEVLEPERDFPERSPEVLHFSFSVSSQSRSRASLTLSRDSSATLDSSSGSALL